MSDRMYDTFTSNAIENFVTVAQTTSPRLILTKRNYADGRQDPYDRVKHFDFFEVRIESLESLYTLCKTLLGKSRCCIIRALIKDSSLKRNVVRKCNGSDATLVLSKQNWFCIDIDGLSGYTGDLLADLNTVIAALPYGFNAECFAVASSSYGFKPGIHMKVFYWSWQPVSHTDLKKAFIGNTAKVDLAIFNPIQLIYTAKPFWIGREDPVQERIVYYSFKQNVTVNIQSYSENYEGAPEKKYTKRQSIGIIIKSFEKIAEASEGDRHRILVREGYLGGHLHYLGHLSEDDALERLQIATSYWQHPNPEKDKEAYFHGFNKGIEQMEGEEP